MADLRRLPAHLLRGTFIWASHRPSLGRLATAVPLTRPMVRRFVAGETLAEALEACDRLRGAGMHTTLDILGESVTSATAAREAATRYVDTLGALAQRCLDGNVSLKLTQMGLDVDPALCRENVGRVAAKAAEVGAFVRVDMEDSPKTEATLTLVRELRATTPDVGAVIQSYLRRSADDVDRLIAEAEAFARREGIDPSRFEFQMLYGIRRDLQARLVREGWNVRVYVPYGREWYPYFMRRLAERPANVLFLLRSVLREGR